MKIFKNILLILVIGVATLNAQNSSQVIYKAGSQGSFNGSQEYFTGNVQVNALFPKNDTTNFTGAYVTFEPNARSAWHIHTVGQHLVIVSGVGKTQEWGKEIQEVNVGDVIWCPPGVKHWHGASNNQSMTHLAITGKDYEDKSVIWMEKVTKEQYNGKIGKIK